MILPIPRKRRLVISVQVRGRQIWLVVSVGS
ncbi:hypothetical protein MGAST_18550 [Mycobacterium gastri 'Wayne']|nr:hypothetical protein MGAST_18550 [Mycobacterium gastri 'Wayne']